MAAANTCVMALQGHARRGVLTPTQGMGTDAQQVQTWAPSRVDAWTESTGHMPVPPTYSVNRAHVNRHTHTLRLLPLGKQDTQTALGPKQTHSRNKYKWEQVQNTHRPTTQICKCISKGTQLPHPYTTQKLRITHRNTHTQHTAGLASRPASLAQELPSTLIPQESPKDTLKCCSASNHCLRGQAPFYL